MHQTEQHDHLSDKVLQMLQEGKTREDAESLLTSMNLPLAFVKELVAESAKLYQSRRQSRGLNLVLIGAMLCFLSFLLTLLGAFPESSVAHNVVLYGLTGTGVCVAFYGFTFIF